MNKRILAIGMATKDHIITPTSEYYQIGGAVFYQTITLNKLNYNVESIISIGEDDTDLLCDIASKVHIIKSRKTHEYTNIYNKKLERKQKAKLQKNPIKKEDINISLDNISYALISPLSPFDITPETMAYIQENNIKTVLLPQGYLRKTDRNNNVTTRRWKEIKTCLEHASIICLDENEAKNAFLTDTIEDEKIQEKLREHDLEQIIITKAEDGSAIYTNDEVYNIPAIRTTREVDATGLGDTYIAAYIAKLEECGDIYEAGLFASITAKEKLENTGPLKTGKEKIEKQLSKYR